MPFFFLITGYLSLVTHFSIRVRRNLPTIPRDLATCLPKHSFLVFASDTTSEIPAFFAVRLIACQMPVFLNSCPTQPLARTCATATIHRIPFHQLNFCILHFLFCNPPPQSPVIPS